MNSTNTQHLSLAHYTNTNELIFLKINIKINWNQKAISFSPYLVTLGVVVGKF
jgi:hypothetical protein